MKTPWILTSACLAFLASPVWAVDAPVCTADLVTVDAEAQTAINNGKDGCAIFVKNDEGVVVQSLLLKPGVALRLTEAEKSTAQLKIPCITKKCHFHLPKL